MQKNLSDIFESITPDNIKNIDVIQNAMAIFIETIEELCQESIDIKNIYENDLIKEQLIQIYLNDLYDVLQNISLNKKITEKIDTINALYTDENKYYDTDVIYNIVNYINDEHFLTLRDFNQTKGRTKAIEYIYKLLSVFITPNERDVAFELTEGKPFEYSVQGSMAKEFFDYVVVPLAHPMGFVYTYEQRISQALIDYYGESSITYSVTKLQVRTLAPDGTTTIDKYIHKTVVKYTTTIESGSYAKYIYFSDGTYLKQVTDSSGQTYVWYMDSNDDVIIAYEDQSSIYFVYTFTYDSGVTEDLSISDTKTTREYYTRLDRRNNCIYIGGTNLHSDGTIGTFYIGDPELIEDEHDNFNPNRDRDGNNLIPSGTQGPENGRWENWFYPSSEADLKLLIGKYEKDVEIYYNDELLEIQKIKYTDTINPAYQVVSDTLTEVEYEEQNIGNEEYFGHEHLLNNVYENGNLLDDNNLSAFQTTEIIDYNIDKIDCGSIAVAFDESEDYDSITIPFDASEDYELPFNALSQSETEATIDYGIITESIDTELNYKYSITV